MARIPVTITLGGAVLFQEELELGDATAVVQFAESKKSGLSPAAQSASTNPNADAVAPATRPVVQDASGGKPAASPRPVMRDAPAASGAARPVWSDDQLSNFGAELHTDGFVDRGPSGGCSVKTCRWQQAPAAALDTSDDAVWRICNGHRAGGAYIESRRRHWMKTLEQARTAKDKTLVAEAEGKLRRIAEDLGAPVEVFHHIDVARAAAAKRAKPSVGSGAIGAAMQKAGVVGKPDAQPKPKSGPAKPPTATEHKVNLRSFLEAHPPLPFTSANAEVLATQLCLTKAPEYLGAVEQHVDARLAATKGNDHDAAAKAKDALAFFAQERAALAKDTADDAEPDDVTFKAPVVAGGQTGDAKVDAGGDGGEAAPIMH